VPPHKLEQHETLRSMREINKNVKFARLLFEKIINNP